MSSQYVRIIFAVAMFLRIITGEAAPLWRWANPTPHGATIYDLTSRGSLVVQVGEFGQLYTSDDLDEWTPRKTGVPNSLRSAVFLGPRLVVTTSEGLILYSDTLDRFNIVNLGTTDWIEGIAASTTRLVAVGDNGAIYTSPNGADWTRQPKAGEWLTSVAYGGGKFLAVGYEGYVITSADGLAWSGGSRISTLDLNKVSWLGDRFWAVGNKGLVMTSANGGSWTTINSGTTNDLFAAASDGNEVVLVGRSELRTSTAPYSSWTSCIGTEPPAPPSWTYFAATHDGAEFLVGGRSGMFVEGYKTNSTAVTTWYSDADAPRNWIWSMTHVGGIYAACGEKGGIFTSLDGFRLSQELVPLSVQHEILEGIAGTPDMLVSVGTAGAIIFSKAGMTNVVSTNSTGERVTNEVNMLGLVWNEVSPRPTVNELQGIGVFGSLFIATGGKGTILTSDDGTNWTLRLSGATKMLSSVTASRTRIVVSGDGGTILTSETGTTWTPRTSGVTNWIYQTRYGNSHFIGVGEAGLIVTSPDGIAWTRQSSGTTNWLNAVCYSEGNYYAGGGGGTLLKSPDGVAWTLLPKNSAKSIYGFASDSGRLLMAGLEGIALRTRLLPWTNSVDFLNIGRTASAQVFLVTGEMDQRFVVQRTPDFSTWLDGPELEILDNSGAYLFYESVFPGDWWFFRTSALPP